ncbi:MAG: SIR2 family protein [Cetobacterium sp.]
MIEKLYGKNINFLIGSGASYGVIPTLNVDWEDNGGNVSIEDILENILEKNAEISKDIVYGYYYTEILNPGFLEKIDENNDVLKNYKKFLEEIIKFLQRENYQKEKRINIFTTNYDLFFEKAADTLTGKYEFFFNDGSSGNITKKLSMKNFHKKIYHTGVFDNFNREIPIINLFKVHGSVSWKYLKDNDKVKEIEVSYQIRCTDETREINKISKKIVEELKDEVKGIKGNRENLRKEFVLVFPEKDKFKETLYEEYYYQYLRQLSYELEKNNSVLIVFGFSFADEHIAELVKRSLSNPGLKIYIYCYNLDSKNMILKKLKIESDKKVEFILPSDNGSLDFDVFIKKLFNKGDRDE